jgi:hypothetical protein
MNFTYFHWKLAETLAKNENTYSLKNMGKEEVQLLVLNIFPGGKTVNHYLCKNVESIHDLYRITRHELSREYAM